MKIKYYSIVYYKSLKNPDIIEIALKPHDTKTEAENTCLKLEKKFKNRIVLTKVKRVDLSKYQDGFWL